MTALVVALLTRFSSLLAAGVGLLVYVILSGGMHLDGLADTADGFMANAPRDKTAQIMHDPALGHFGVMSLVIYCLLVPALIDLKLVMVSLLVILFCEYLIKYSIKKLGGLTGDVHGASIEVSELICLLLGIIVPKG